MRQTLLAAAVAFVLGGIATGAVLSQAQPAPAPVQETGAVPQNGGMAGWRHHMMGAGSGGEGMAHRPFNRRDFALVYRGQDRNLAAADVQKIAEAFLLWNGNHAWKVSEVAATPEGPIGFSLTTAEGSVIAKFTMDPHNGHIRRIG